MELKISDFVIQRNKNELFSKSFTFVMLISNHNKKLKSTKSPGLQINYRR